jgi:putative flippase GtrA
MLPLENETRVETHTEKAKRRIKHASKFGIVGVLNTTIDFVIYNLLSSKVGLGLIQSNIVSTTVAMTFSFWVNKKLVFKKHDGTVVHQMVLFLAVTMFGLYVLQNATIIFLTDIWHYPMLVLLDVVHVLGIHGFDDFLVKNGAKAAATLVSLTWNYIMYKKVVFK